MEAKFLTWPRLYTSKEFIRIRRQNDTLMQPKKSQSHQSFQLSTGYMELKSFESLLASSNSSVFWGGGGTRRHPIPDERPHQGGVQGARCDVKELWLCSSASLELRPLWKRHGDQMATFCVFTLVTKSSWDQRQTFLNSQRRDWSDYQCKE